MTESVVASFKRVVAGGTRLFMSHGMRDPDRPDEYVQMTSRDKQHFRTADE